MLIFFRGTVLRNVIGLLLISLFSIKMMGSVSCVIAAKYLCCEKILPDNESEQKEVKKDADKKFKCIEYLSLGDKHLVRSVGNAFTSSLGRYDHSSRTDHYGSVPTPPPDRYC